jgi:hypothetical protein
VDTPLSPEQFERLGEAELALAAGEQRLTARIADVRRLGSDDNPDRRAFSVLFRTAESQALEQQIFRVEHPDLGAHDLFLVPLGPSDGGFDYEAVFT